MKRNQTELLLMSRVTLGLIAMKNYSTHLRSQELDKRYQIPLFQSYSQRILNAFPDWAGKISSRCE